MGTTYDSAGTFTPEEMRAIEADAFVLGTVVSRRDRA